MKYKIKDNFYEYFRITKLWSGDLSEVGDTCTLSEPSTSYDFIAVTFGYAKQTKRLYIFPSPCDALYCSCTEDNNPNKLIEIGMSLVQNATDRRHYRVYKKFLSTWTECHIFEIYGIKVNIQ